MSKSLSKLLVNRKQRASVKEPIQPSILKSRISPVELPEILSQIFSYLTRREIRLSVLRVCKLWNSLGRDIIPCVNTWNVARASSELSLVEHLLNFGTDVLRCVGAQRPTKPKPGFSLHPGIWLMLGSILEALPRWKLMRIKTVAISGYIDPDISLYPFIPIFCGLKTLRLERLTTDVVLLDTVLRLCPNITDLFVGSENPHIEASRRLEFEFEKIPLPALRLRSLTLSRWTIKMSTLQLLLRQCQYVQELKLVRLHFQSIRKVVSIEDYTRLLHGVAISCPRVRSLHFSLGHQLLDHPLFTEIMYAFPNLEAWSVELQDANCWMYDYLQAHMLQTLTTLEITYVPHQHYSFQKRLHHFLCEASNLLHLRAEGFMINVNDIFVLMDPLPSRNPIGDSIDLRTVGSENEPTKKIWACRNLRTLRIGFQGDTYASTHKAVKSRALFAYITNVCPRLSELHLNHDYISFAAEGGFCLLSGLDGLRYLSAHSAAPTENCTFPTKDLEWFRSDGKRVPWVQMTGIQKIMWKKYLVSLRSGVFSDDENRQYKPPTSLAARWLLNRSTLSPDDQLIYDIQKTSSLDNVAKVLDKLRRCDTPCWPLLETLHVKSSFWEKNVRELRPGLERGVLDEWARMSP